MTSQYNLSQIGQTYAQTAAEISAGVTPTNYGYPFGHVHRYGAVGNGVTDDSVAIQTAVASGAKNIIFGNGLTYKANIALTSSSQYINIVFNLNGSTLTSNTGTVLKINKFNGFSISNGTIDGQSGSATYGLQVGDGGTSGADASNLYLFNVTFTSFSNSCVNSLNISYSVLENCYFNPYSGSCLTGTFYSCLDIGSQYAAWTNGVVMTSSSGFTFDRSYFYTQVTATPASCVTLTDCDHFEFLNCTIEPLVTCTTAQVYINSSSTYSSDVHFTACYWLGDLAAARNSDSIKTAGTVHRLRLIKNDFYIVGSGYYNLNIGSTGQAFEIWDCYRTSHYNEATRSNMTINNPGNQEYYNQNLGTLSLGNASTSKGLFVTRSDGTLQNAGQLYYNDYWQFVTAGTNALAVNLTSVNPGRDNVSTLGNSSFRWQNLYCTYQKFTPVTVASLGGAGAVGIGGKAFVSDATATTFASIVVGGGTNNVPVYSDGTNWRIG